MWWIFTREVPFDKLNEIRELIAAEPTPEPMNKKITQLAQMGGVSIAVGG